MVHHWLWVEMPSITKCQLHRVGDAFSCFNNLNLCSSLPRPISRPWRRVVGRKALQDRRRHLQTQVRYRDVHLSPRRRSHGAHAQLHPSSDESLLDWFFIRAQLGLIAGYFDAVSTLRRRLFVFDPRNELSQHAWGPRKRARSDSY